MVKDLMHVHNFHCQMVNGVKMVFFLEVDNSSSVHAGHRKKDVLVDGLDDATIIAEAKYFINIAKSRKKTYLSLHYNGSNSFLYDNVVKINSIQKAKDSEIKSYPVTIDIYDWIYTYPVISVDYNTINIRIFRIFIGNK